MSVLCAFLLAVGLLVALVASVATYAALVDRRSACAKTDQETPLGHALLGDVLLLPTSPTNCLEPGIPAKAIRRVVRLMEHDLERKPRFQTILDRLPDFLSTDPTTWREQLILLADRDRWPTWAVFALPAISFIVSRHGDEATAYIWEHAFEAWPREMAPTIQDRLCAGQVLRVTVTGSALVLFPELATCSETIRRECPYSDPLPSRHQLRAELPVELAKSALTKLGQDAAARIRQHQREWMQKDLATAD